DLLGRSYSLAGSVVQGCQTGNTIGYPTANIQTDAHLIPAQGVYAAWVLLDGVPRQGVVNIGFNPTFQRNRLSVEVHILDFNRQIYGEEIEVEFVRRLRDEIAFSSADALVCQIQKDIQIASEILRAETSRKKAGSAREAARFLEEASSERKSPNR
ncbi:MAG: riboflavin kinase, partial [Nitrospinales bacterium]